MRIIKHGDVPKAKATCPVCGCEFEFEPRDVDECSFSLSSTYSHNGAETKRYSVRCPDCGTSIPSELRVSAKEWPFLELPSVMRD